MGQSDSEVWKEERLYVVTASDIHEFKTDAGAEAVCKRKFGLTKPINHLQQIRWGRDNEINAIRKFEAKYGGKVVRSGLHISKRNPIFGEFLLLCAVEIDQERVISS